MYLMSMPDNEILTASQSQMVELSVSCFALQSAAALYFSRSVANDSGNLHVLWSHQPYKANSMLLLQC